MKRRSLLKASLALGTYGLPLGGMLMSSACAAGGAGDHVDFDYVDVMAAGMSHAAYKGAEEKLPPTLANLTPQQYSAIRFDPQQALWRNRLSTQFFHVGMGFRQRVRMFALDKDDRAHEINFSTQLFNYSGAGVDEKAVDKAGDLGFAGFKIFNSGFGGPGDIVAFLGASYFRAVDKTGQYGLSARGLAIDPAIGGKPEEFPYFTHFWFREPAADSPTCTVYALLDSPSVTGAYQFDIDCQSERVVMTVRMKLHVRRPIERLGIAPMTSMFACGTNERQVCDTIHPQIHDSDRLSMWRGNGEWVCRPLNNPDTLQYNAFADTNPKGFGLVQTDHDFNSYQDTVDWYSRRPSLWIEPLNSWGEGSIDLAELPTTGETSDNIVAYWRPKTPAQAGDTLEYHYRLYWSALPPVSSPLASVMATRTGMGGFTEGWAPGDHFPNEWCRRFAVDFSGDALKALPANAPITPRLDVSWGEVRDLQVLPLPDNGYRVLFDWYPTSQQTDPVSMRLYIVHDDSALSETWLYQYLPPAPERRRYTR
ncbi:glucan biosynthesis protein [Zymobacter sp. IVIA_12111.31 C1]|uniref:glucan biosynthesis protein n=1 Tax=Zymobacter sp. IVIA_12111.31 C1 TaxID=3394854 RepID=UPI0039C3A03B